MVGCGQVVEALGMADESDGRRRHDGLLGLAFRREAEEGRFINCWNEGVKGQIIDFLGGKDSVSKCIQVDGLNR